MNTFSHRLTHAVASLSFFAILIPSTLAQDTGTRANYKLAAKYSNDFVNQFVHSTTVSPNWIGETARFWYEFQTSDGNHYWLVDPAVPSKAPLFDHDLMAGFLSEELRSPIDSTHLDLGNLSIDDDGTTLKFVVKDHRFEFTLETAVLENKGEVPENQRGQRGGRGRGGRGRGGRGRGGRGGQAQDEDEEDEPGAHRNFSPDHTAYVFGQLHNLYYVEASDEVKASIAEIDAEMEAAEEAGEEEEETEEQEADEEEEMDEREKWAEEFDETAAIQLTSDGEEFYSWARPGGGGRRNLEEKIDEEELQKKVQPSINWAPDSTAFYVTRNDSRDVNDLYLVNSLSEPRPTLERYQYAMPGEEKISRADLFYFDRNRGQISQVEPLWIDEGFQNINWYDEAGDELRFVRRDRLRRNLDFCKLNTRTGEVEVILSERYEVGLIGIQEPRYLEDREEMIWWSERSGWGHYYLYDLDGNLKNVITLGPFYARQILEVDEEKGILYFRGNGREKGENIYYSHLYRVFLDGTGMTLMDSGNATHTSVLSPNQRFVVDNFNRLDQAPKSVLRNADDDILLELEEADLSALIATGWKLPETFKIKAADGVTDLYGNMWKPFDFDETAKYPIIAHVYPGPQQEGVSHTFSATGGGRQALANLGFIVIQVGHRGGTPGRSKAYQNFSYFNMRDYGLPDKKAAIEKLAAIHPFIDVERVGIYGHSGGGFMTGTALMLPPYNDFFTVGVSSSGNHDNNVYNNSWSERYHGLREVELEEETDEETDEGNGNDNGNRGQGRGRGQRGGRGQGRGGRRGRGQTGEDQDEEQDEETLDSDRFEIHIPTNAELAENLKGHLLLVHGDMDNNVHPAGTIRLVDALIKANKRFDLLIIPGARHGFGAASGYFTQRMWEYFSEHLLDDYQSTADINDKSGKHR